MAFTVPTWVLWLQAGYSLWTFLRNAKFFRIPFIVLSMAWHGFNATWFGQRKYLLLDGRSRETGGDWSHYDTEEERKSHSFSLENSHDMRFKLKETDYRFCASFEMGKPLKFLHYATHYQIVTEDIVLMGKWHLVKSAKPESMLDYVLTGGTMKSCEEYCLVDNTSSELLNDNFMRILSILPLALQAKGYDQFSTLVSATLVIMDIFSYFFNFVWQACKVFTFKYTKLTLARLPVKYRVFIHELLNTGSDSFMYCDDSLKKAYYKTVDRVMVLRGCEIPLDATTADLPNVGDLPDRLEIKMNLNTFVLEIESLGDLYNISITDRNNYRERREYLERGYTIKLINYFKYCDETGNYPFRHIKTGSAHVLNPVKAMIDGVYEWALTVRLKQPRKLFISDSTI
uniref:Uncharacterized protein n=1 Tax=Picea sitchensis TaxID=3332 RepID=A9NXA9_PICSI|nr:unknown [Picea sitchensis]